MGGAMDLVAGVGRVLVVMDHTSKHGESKVLKTCTLPLTGQGVVNRVITNLGVFDVVPGGLRIVECADGVTEADLRAATEATIVEFSGCSACTDQRCLWPSARRSGHQTGADSGATGREIHQS